MNRKQLVAVLTVLTVLLSPSISRAQVDITAAGNGDWSSTTPNAPWPDGIVPGSDDSVEVPAGINVTVDSVATIGFLYGDGTVTMAPGSTLTVTDTNGAYGTVELASLLATAPDNTVIYTSNPFWAKRTDYYNLVFTNTTTATQIDFYNGTVSSQVPATPMTIGGDMTVVGRIKVQQGTNISIGGNLLLDSNAKWDASLADFTVGGNLTLGAGSLLLDLDGANGTNHFAGDVTVNSSAIGWNVSDVITWGIGGSLTNNGLIVGTGYGSISFDGTGVIGGSSPITIPTITVNGAYTIGTTITLTTNTPTLNGTLVFDIASTNQIVLKSFGTNLMTFYYDGLLEIINSGPDPVAGNSYKFFSATNYDGTFDLPPILPVLPDGLSWVDNLLASGSIAVIGGAPGGPVLSALAIGTQLTLSWDSTTFPGYSVQAQTNSSGPGTTGWGPTGSGTDSPYVTTINRSNPPVFYRLFKP